MLLDEHRMQGGVEVAPVAEARSFHGGQRVEHCAGAERHAGLAKRAGEMDDVLGQRAAADRGWVESVVHGEPASTGRWTTASPRSRHIVTRAPLATWPSVFPAK